MDYSMDSIRRGISVLKAYDRGQRNFANARIGAADLSNAYLQGADFSGAYLRHSNLRGADLSGAKLTGANLSKADLFRACLLSVDLRGADLFGTCMAEALLANSDLRKANIGNALSLVMADLSDVNLSGTYMQGAHLQGANLTGADLDGCDLYGADLTGVNAHNTSLRNADLSGACLSYADMTDADMQGAKLSTSTQLGGVIFQRTSGAPNYANVGWYNHGDTGRTLYAWEVNTDTGDKEVVFQCGCFLGTYRELVEFIELPYQSVFYNSRKRALDIVMTLLQDAAEDRNPHGPNQPTTR